MDKLVSEPAKARRKPQPRRSVIEATADMPMPVVEAAAPHADPVAEPIATESTPPVAATPVAPPAAVPAVFASKDHPMDTIENTTPDAMFGTMNDRAKGAMEKGTRMVEELASFNKGTVEALVESSRIAARGLESLGQDAAAFAKQQFEQSTAAIKTLATVKSPTEFMKLQGDLMRQSFDQMVAQTSRSTETMLKLAGEVAQPLSNRMALAAEKIKVAA